MDVDCLARKAGRRYSDSGRGLLHLDGPIRLAYLWRNTHTCAMGRYRPRHAGGGLHQPGWRDALKAIGPIAEPVEHGEARGNRPRPKSLE